MYPTSLAQVYSIIKLARELRYTLLERERTSCVSKRLFFSFQPLTRITRVENRSGNDPAIITKNTDDTKTAEKVL